jgi:hypothetical protein
MALIRSTGEAVNMETLEEKQESMSAVPSAQVSQIQTCYHWEWFRAAGPMYQLWIIDLE